MSQSEHAETLPPQSPRLGIIHFLGWITGVAIVLAAYRAALESGWLEVPQAGIEETRWWQLGYGLVYGTALSTIGLLLYRRLHGDSRFPAHPGHWLLVFGGLAFFVDAAAFGTAKGLIALWKTRFGFDPGWYYCQQFLAWGIALVVAVIFLTRLKTDWNWRLLAMLIVILVAVNWLTHTLVVIEVVTQALGYRLGWGAWPFYGTHVAEIVGVGVCLLAMPIVIGCDRHPRDWLHWVGVAATIVLALVEEANQIQVLVRAR
jgi:hypothetical protein